MKIGGIDNQVVKDTNTDKPYIPGSSLKGKMRSLFGITRISIGDCKVIEKEGQKLTEAKYENVINRQNGTAEHPRQTERVPAGVEFEYEIRVKVLPQDKDKEDDFKKMIERGLELIEKD